MRKKEGLLFKGRWLETSSKKLSYPFFICQGVLDWAGHSKFEHKSETTKKWVERLEGNTTTDFGAPAVAPSSDTRPFDDADLRRLQILLQACWQAFDIVMETAVGKELRPGPRGGGRNQEGIIQHVLDSDGAYLAQLGWKFKQGVTADQERELHRTQQAALEALAAAAHLETTHPSAPLPFRSRLASKFIVLLTAVFLAAAAIWSIITPSFLEDQYARLPADPGGLTPSERLDLAHTAASSFSIRSNASFQPDNRFGIFYLARPLPH